MQSELAVDLCYEPGRLSRCDFGAEPLLDGGPKTIARVGDPLDGCKRVIDGIVTLTRAERLSGRIGPCSPSPTTATAFRPR
jgi:hypothetical protein